jgi:hypothetical protein
MLSLHGGEIKAVIPPDAVSVNLEAGKEVTAGFLSGWLSK